MTLLSPATIQCFDLYPASADVTRLDVNDLDGLALRSCDVVTLLRTSVFIRNPQRVLTGFHRILRPGGVAIVDWLHGSSDAPVLDLGHYTATYLDAEILRLPAFAEFLEHVQHPPRLRHAARVLLRRLRHPRLPSVPFLGRGHAASTATYSAVLRRMLEEAGKHLITARDLESYFVVRDREARYFYPWTHTFSCWALTIMERI
jgi:SAM-dependent methyltransferase